MESRAISTLSGLRSANLYALGGPARGGNTPASAADGLDLSSNGSFLAGQKVARANLQYAQVESMQFHLNYTTTREEQASASGVLYRKSSSLDVSFSYDFYREVMVDGAMQKKKFHLSLNISAASIEQIQASPRHEKEDIVHFLRRVVDDIFKHGRDADTKVDGVTFDPNDLMEIAGVDHGKILGYLHALLTSLSMLAQRREQHEGKNLPSVMLSPTRGEHHGADVEKESARSFSFHLNIEEMESTVVTATLPAAEPAAAVQAPAPVETPETAVAA
jgi:hypothetical protein